VEVFNAAPPTRHYKPFVLADSRRAANSFLWDRMIQPYDLVTALDLNSLMLFFWFTLLFDLPRYIIKRDCSGLCAMALAAAQTLQYQRGRGRI